MESAKIRNGKRIMTTSLEEIAERQVESSQKNTEDKGVDQRHLERSTGTEEDRISQALKKLTFNQNMKFMENFDPEQSNRERRKLTRKITTSVVGTTVSAGKRFISSVHDEHGYLSAYGKDLCDCLEEACQGCHFPCTKCRSVKCGHECRTNRKYCIESIEIEGMGVILKNEFR
uniref:ARF7 effector protein C-terminal domain-containing protein n=1 Tax=Timema shepardi TaxID=629360 RepID=A0A7R9AQ22_TIMSH|nr:unnamed protein product [Timema shepardi]